jgi:hypothetical protein
MQDFDVGFAQRDVIPAPVQCRQIQIRTPETRFVAQQVQLRIVATQHFLNTVNVIVVTVRQQNVRDTNTVAFGQCQHLRNVPSRVDHGGPTACAVFDQIDEIFHGPEFEGTNKVRTGIGHMRPPPAQKLRL